MIFLSKSADDAILVVWSLVGGWTGQDLGSICDSTCNLHPNEYSNQIKLLDCCSNLVLARLEVYCVIWKWLLKIIRMLSISIWKHKQPPSTPFTEFFDDDMYIIICSVYSQKKSPRLTLRNGEEDETSRNTSKFLWIGFSIIKFLPEFPVWISNESLSSSEHFSDSFLFSSSYHLVLVPPKNGHFIMSLFPP